MNRPTNSHTSAIHTLQSLPNSTLTSQIATSTSSCIQGNHFCLTVTPHGSRKTTAHSTAWAAHSMAWAATTEQKCVNWLACSLSTDWPTNTGKKVSDSTGTTGSQFSRTPQDHKQNESGKTSLDTSRTTNTGKKDYYTDQLKNRELPRCHLQPYKWILLPLQKT